MGSHIAQLQDPKGTPFQLTYLDSFDTGNTPSESQDYLTIVACHGAGYNSSAWTSLIKMLPQGIRFLAYDQRGYGGSSPAIEEHAITDVARCNAQDLAAFIQYVIEVLKVPSFKFSSVGSPQSGIVLMGWSKGTVICFGFMNLVKMGYEDSSRLKKYLRQVILFEPPGSLVNSERSVFFNLPGEENLGLVEVLTKNYRDSRLKNWTLSKEAQEVYDRSYEAQNISYSFKWKLASTPDETKEIVTQLLTDPWDGFQQKPFWGLIYGTETIPYFLDMAQNVAKLWKDNQTGVIKAVPGNHFAFMDYPGSFWKAVTELLT